MSEEMRWFWIKNDLSSGGGFYTELGEDDFIEGECIAGTSQRSKWMSYWQIKLVFDWNDGYDYRTGLLFPPKPRGE